MNNLTKRQLLSVLVNLGMLGAPGIVLVELFPRAFHDRPLRYLVAWACCGNRPIVNAQIAAS
jgi:hypothetical protein